MITLKIENQIRLFPVNTIRPEILSMIKRWLTFDNPQYLENDRRGFSNWDTEPTIQGYKVQNNIMEIPRGFAGQLISILKENHLKFSIVDNRRSLPATRFQFIGTLKPFQKDAAQAMLSKDFGLLAAPTGSGKTVIGLYVMVARKQSALIIVHTKELMNQWIDRVHTFLGIPKEDIGIIGDGKQTIGQGVTVGIVNSIYPIASEIKKYFGMLIVDECHRCPSRIFTEAVSAFDSKYMLGLSATPWRRDKLSRLIFWNVGNKIHEIPQEMIETSGDVLRAEIISRETRYTTCRDASKEYSTMLSELTEDQARNAQITRDVIEEARNGSGICLILTDRKAHCETLASMIKARGIGADVLTGDLSDKERQATVERLNAGKVKILVATGQLIGEGFDCKELSTLFLACPIKFKGRLIQYFGRVLRPAPGKKKARVYDYVDSGVGVLANAAKGRQRVYMRTA